MQRKRLLVQVNLIPGVTEPSFVLCKRIGPCQDFPERLQLIDPVDVVIDMKDNRSYTTDAALGGLHLTQIGWRAEVEEIPDSTPMDAPEGETWLSNVALSYPGQPFAFIFSDTRRQDPLFTDRQLMPNCIGFRLSFDLDGKTRIFKVHTLAGLSDANLSWFMRARRHDNDDPSEKADPKKTDEIKVKTEIKDRGEGPASQAWLHPASTFPVD